MTGEEWAETVREALAPFDRDEQYRIIVSPPDGERGVNVGWNAYAKSGTEYGMAVLFLPLGSVIDPTRWALAIAADFGRTVRQRHWTVPSLRDKP